MEAQIIEAGKVIDPNEKVIVWKIGEYLLIKKVDERKILEKVNENRERLDRENKLLPDEEVVKLVKEAREEWKKL